MTKSDCNKRYRLRHPDKVKEFNTKWNPINNPNRINFKGEIKYVGFNPRKGICSWCNKSGKTRMHHINYHDENPLKDTVELCESCHRKEHFRLRCVT